MQINTSYIRNIHVAHLLYNTHSQETSKFKSLCYSSLYTIDLNIQFNISI